MTDKENRYDDTVIDERKASKTGEKNHVDELAEADNTETLCESVDIKEAVCDDEGSGETVGDEAQPEEYTPMGKYDAALYYVYKDETLAQILKIISYLCVALTVYAYGFKLVTFFPIAPLETLRFLVICGVPFVAVSIARKIINAPRPYELYPFYKTAPKSKKGSGYPSRHVFSIFVIAATLAFENIFLGIGLALLGVVLAACRVLLGMHFIKDTVAGAVIGIASAVLGMYITRAIF